MEADVLVIGSGVAGLLLALKCADRGADVLVVTKLGADDTSTNWAQGGIAAVFDTADTIRRIPARRTAKPPTTTGRKATRCTTSGRSRRRMSANSIASRSKASGFSPRRFISNGMTRSPASSMARR